jgi:hypothetical protein
LSYVYEFPLALPLAGVPIPGKSNPYIIVVTPNSAVRVSVDVDSSDVPRASVRGVRLGWRFEIAFKSFVDTLSARLEQPVKIEVSIDAGRLSYPPPAPIYAATTLAVVHAVADAGGYHMEPNEVLEAANSIDSEAGVDLDYVDGLRAALTTAESIVYRRGEEPITLGTERRVELELVGEEDVGEDYTGKMGENVLSAVTRLGGISVVEAVALIREGRVDEAFELARRVDNSLFYLLYSVNPPEGECKWTPSLQRVYGICLRGVGLGETVEFTL